MIKKLICFALMIISFSVVSAGAEFTDISDIGGRDAILSLYEKGIIEGTSETTFSPNDNLTRAQFAAFVVRAFELPISEKRGTFSDVAADAWYAGCVETAAEYGYINGYDEMFNPEDFVTKEEAIKILVCAFESNAEQINSAMAYTTAASDIFSISPWAREYVGKGFLLGIVSYDIEAVRPYALTVNTASYATREEAAVMLNRILNAVSSYQSRVYIDE